MTMEMLVDGMPSKLIINDEGESSVCVRRMFDVYEDYVECDPSDATYTFNGGAYWSGAYVCEYKLTEAFVAAEERDWEWWIAELKKGQQT